MEQHRQAMQQEFYRRFRTPDAQEHRAGRDEKEAWEEDWDDGKTPNEWYEGDTVDPAVSPDRCQDANGGSCGGGNPSTPRNGTHVRGQLSFPTWETWQDGG